MNDVGVPAHRWAVPIDGGGPAAGSDVTYDPRFEQISAEIQKLSALSGGRPEWKLVDEQGEVIIAKASKDLRVGAWVTLAKVQLSGWAGLADCLQGLHAMIVAHWGEMHPPLARLRARVNVFEWLWTHLPPIVAALPVAESDAAACDAAVRAFSAIGGELESRLESANPSGRELRTALLERQAALPQPTPPAEPPAPAQAPSGEVAVTPVSVASAPPPTPAAAFDASNLAVPAAAQAENLDQAMDIARSWSEVLFGLARQARRAAPASGWPYRLARTAAWLTVESLPEIEVEDRTYVRAPRTAEQRTLTDFLTRSDWSALVDASEEALAEHPLWLDLHRYSAMALDHLGHRDARAAVGREASATVRRFPRLLDLRFSGGTPLADAETRAWFEQEMNVWGGGGAPTARDDGDAAFLEAARVRIGSGDVVGGVAQALRAARELTSARSRFRGRALVADLALTSGEADVAKAIAEELLGEIQPSAEAWAPDDVGLCYQVFIRAERNLAAAGERAPDERVESVLKRLLQVDPESALRLWR